MNKKWLLSLLLAGIIAVLGACGDSDESADKGKDKEADKGEKTEEGQADVPEPDLEGIPDVVAEVNGESIPKEEFENVYMTQFQQAVMQAQMSQQELNQDDLKKQVADLLIDQELVIQEAKGKDYKATDEDINKTLDGLVKQSGLESKEKFLEAMKDQDMNEDEVMEEIEKQVLVEQLIAEEAGDIEPSEDEIKDFYAKYKEQMKQSDKDKEVPALDELKPQIVDQLKSEKESETYQSLVKKLRKDADITNNL